MLIVNVHEAKTQLSKMLEAVARGEKVIIAKADSPVAELVPYRRPALQLGGFEGEIDIADDFDSAEVNERVQALFEGAG
jgi:prevent-host-death family protein